MRTAHSLAYVEHRLCLLSAQKMQVIAIGGYTRPIEQPALGPGVLAKACDLRLKLSQPAQLIEKGARADELSAALRITGVLSAMYVWRCA